jgi:hypothetical protein
VVVRIGRTRTEIGSLEYAGGHPNGPLTSNPFWNRRMTAAVLLTLIGLTLGMAGLGLLWRRRQGQHERTYRRIQLQMEQMESQVRQECKQVCWLY